jgi:putative transposase
VGRIFQPLLFMLARCTRHELIREIEFLRAENKILRAHMKQHHVNPAAEERSRLVELGNAIRPAIKQLISIVTYETFVRWTRVGPPRKMVRRRPQHQRLR